MCHIATTQLSYTYTWEGDAVRNCRYWKASSLESAQIHTALELLYNRQIANELWHNRDVQLIDFGMWRHAQTLMLMQMLTRGIGLAAPVSPKEGAALTGGEDGSVSINTCASSSLQAGNKERALQYVACQVRSHLWWIVPLIRLQCKRLSTLVVPLEQLCCGFTRAGSSIGDV